MWCEGTKSIGDGPKPGPVTSRDRRCDIEAFQRMIELRTGRLPFQDIPIAFDHSLANRSRRIDQFPC